MEHPLKMKVSNLSWKSCYDSLKTRNKLNSLTALDYLTYVRCYSDFEFFVRTFFPHHVKVSTFSKMHQDFFEEEKDPARRGRRDAIAAPRSHAKTTYKAFFKVLHAIVYGYEPFILIISHSASEAEEKVRAVLEELEGNDRLRRIYGNLAPVPGQLINGSRWGKKWFITQNGVRVQAKSKGQQVRGLKHGPNRPTLIICDDVESAEGVMKPDPRKKTSDWFFKDVMKCGQIDGSTNVTIVGTCLHPDSLLSNLLKVPGWRTRKYQAVSSFSSHPELWEKYRNLYTNLASPARLAEAHTFYLTNQAAMLTGVEVLWPEGESYERLMRMRIDEGEASFSSEKQNDPYDPELQLFKMDLAKKCRIHFEGKALKGIQWLDGSNKAVMRSSITRIVAFHDPALGKEGTNSDPDFSAIVVVAQDKDDYLYCLDAWIEKQPPSVQVERALLLNEKWGFDTLYLEDNLFQDLLKTTYRDAQEKRTGKPVRVVGVSQYSNKIQRISTLEPEITNGYLLFADSLNPRLINQMILFPTTKDDGPDALQGAVAQLKKRIVEPSIGAPIQVGNGSQYPF